MCLQIWSLQCGGVKSADYWVSAHPLSILLELSIFSFYKVPPSAHYSQNCQYWGFSEPVGVVLYTRITRTCLLRKGDMWVFLVIPSVSLCWHELGQRLSCFQAAPLPVASHGLIIIMQYILTVEMTSDNMHVLYVDIWQFTTQTSIDMHVMQCILYILKEPMQILHPKPREQPLEIFRGILAFCFSRQLTGTVHG